MNTFFIIAILGFQVFQDASGGILSQVDGVDSETSARHTRAATGCKAAHRLKPGAPAVKLTSTKDECTWTLLGDTNCKPALHCNSVDIKKDDDCSDEYIYVSDGSGNDLRICGHLTFDKPLLAGRGGRDLFVKVSSDKTIVCSAQCSTGPGIELPEAEKHRKEEFNCVCGLQNKDDRIVGGEDTKANEFPWQVAIVYSGTRAPKCGGTIINNQYVLTASHCFWFEKTKPQEIEVLAHAYILDMTKKDIAADVALGQMGSIRGSGYNKKAYTDAEEKTQRFRVTEIIMHPFFTENYDYDYALLKLDRKIDLTSADAPTPICLPSTNLWNSTFEKTNPTVVGWGMPDENAGGTTRVLQKLDVPVIPLSKCQEWLPGTVTQRMICAGFEEGKKDACTGDSGGPLILKQTNKQWWQIGVVSWGEGCAQKHKPGLYSRVTEMLPWIRYHAHDAKWCRDTKN